MLENSSGTGNVGLHAVAASRERIHCFRGW